MMRITDEIINGLREQVRERLSEKRYIHTLGVEDMAVRIGQMCLPDSIDELRVAALLHDISKEYSEAEHLEIAKRHDVSFSDADLMAPAIWHSITGPLVIVEDFSPLADERVLSAVRNHTGGAPDMSVFDEIIFLADYIEDGRDFVMCRQVREEFFSLTKNSHCYEDYLRALHRATLSSLQNTINFFVSRGKSYHERTEHTLKAILDKIERQ